ncbi:energy transducer TonB [Parvularcula lutaonensis]|uniref:TonB family protein n=1 Tax=Parvularcula lutaonensis TaxID=491923 RepID=A0ABV7M7I8_9PROT|nr:energy transducer TonB [Parvularcula lutaonensis]
MTLLFLFMAGVISVDDITPGEKVEREKITIGMPDPEPERTKPEKPKIDEIVEPDPPEWEKPSLDPNPLGKDDLTFDDPSGGAADPSSLQLNTAPTPLIRADPTGFDNCFAGGRANQVQRVRVEFDITPAGETANVRVVDSTDSCFDRSAVRAVRRWRYNPKVERGEAVWQYGVQTTIVYQPPE